MEMNSQNKKLNPLTGLLFGNDFYHAVEVYLKESSPSLCYCMMAIDIEHFRLFNQLHGREEGDIVLRKIADVLKDYASEYGGVVGYLGGDNFGIVCVDNISQLDVLRSEIRTVIQMWNNTIGYLPAFGIYPIYDKKVSPATMYDCATIALEKVIGNYATRVCEYQPEMEKAMEEEISLLAEIQEGIVRGDFTFFIQPQVNIITRKIVGGECLVRWMHPEKGMVSPAVFVPILEENGFIADLDRDIWRQVCEWLRARLDEDYDPVPLSINVSRIDIYTMDVVKYLTELVEELSLPTELLKIEITESAYTDSKGKILEAVNGLREYGFVVMMDDFGSGYSSLNMLKSVPVDIVKMDMRFLQIEEGERERGINILESVINMTKQMQVPIVVEGVETRFQEEFLTLMGCGYAQGYYYYRPMSQDKFLEFLEDENMLEHDGFICRQTESTYGHEFLDTTLISNATINSILGPAAYYDLYDNKIDIARANEQYCKLAGYDMEKAEEGVRLGNHIRDDERPLLYSIFSHAYDFPMEGGEGHIHFMRTDGVMLWVSIRVFFLREKAGHKYFYASLRDMSSYEGTYEKKVTSSYSQNLDEDIREQLGKYFEEFPYGYVIASVSLNDDNVPDDYELLYANKTITSMCEGDMVRLRQMYDRMIMPKRAEVLQKAYEAAHEGKVSQVDLYSGVSSRYLQFIMYPFMPGYVSCILRDATHARLFENALNHVMYDYREVYHLHIKDNYCRMLHPSADNVLERGNYEELVNRHFGSGIILPEDEKNVRKFLSLKNIQRALQKEDSIRYTYRRRLNDVADEWCLTTIAVSERSEDGTPKTAVLTVRSIESIVRERGEYRSKHMSEMLENFAEGFFIYSANKEQPIIFSNEKVWKLFGCEHLKDFRDYTGNTFPGIVHPEDLDRIQAEIDEQIRFTDNAMDYITYRIIRKDGEVRWIDDYGHMEYIGFGEESVYYVFLYDVTDTLSETKKNKLIHLSQKYNEKKGLT